MDGANVYFRLTLGSSRYDPFANVCVSFIFRKCHSDISASFQKKKERKVTSCFL